MNEPVYLDNNASAPLAAECREAMFACLNGPTGNPASKHSCGMAVQGQLAKARAQVAALFGASPGEIVFTSGGTESNHLAVLGALALAGDKRHIVSSTTEHPSTLLLLRELEERGVRVSYLQVDGDGLIDPADVEKTLTPDTALLTLSWANNETGVIAPMEAVAAIAREKGVLLHIDAVQAVGKFELDLAAVRPDLLSVSGHKLHAPAGIGALYVRKGVQLAPQLFGHQERARRGGTPNTSGIVALGTACELIREGGIEAITQMSVLRQRLEQAVTASIPCARINGEAAPRVANTSNIRFGRLPAEVIVDRLDAAGICVALGAACTAGGNEPSHVLLAMGLDRDQAEASVRFSTSRYTTEAEIDRAVAALVEVVGKLEAAAA
jgi:cysteine desulfurase